MPSREAMQIAEQYTPDCGGGFGEKLRAGKVNALARSIDELRVRDLEAVAKSGYTWGGVQNYVEQQIAALKSTTGDEGGKA